MTNLEFHFDEASLAEDMRHSPESATSAMLEETYFVMPVRLCVNGVELLEQPNREVKNLFVARMGHAPQRFASVTESCWLPLPLLGFATHGLQRLRQVKGGDEQKLYLSGGGQLDFILNGERIAIKSSLNDRSSLAQLPEIVNAFQDFSESIRELLVHRIPSIQQHASWKQWFPDSDAIGSLD
jgi:hypothetical protein